MHKSESIQENEAHKFLWDFEIQTDLILTSRPVLIVVNQKNKRTCRPVDFAVSANHRLKVKENEKRDKFLDFARELKIYGTQKGPCYQL